MNPLARLPPGMAALSRLRVLELYYVRLTPDGEADVARLQAGIPGLFIFSNAPPPAPVRAPAALPMEGPPEGEGEAAAAAAAGHPGARSVSSGGGGGSPSSGAALLSSSPGGASSSSSGASGSGRGRRAGAIGAAAATTAEAQDDSGADTEDLEALLCDMGLGAPPEDGGRDAAPARGRDASGRVAPKPARAGRAGGDAGGDAPRGGAPDQRRAGHADYERPLRRRTHYGDD
jgi:hypothetical protein